MNRNLKKLFAYVSIPILEMIETGKFKCELEINLKVIIDRKFGFEKISNRHIFIYTSYIKLKEAIIVLLNA